MKNKIISVLFLFNFLVAFSQEPPQKKGDLDSYIDDFLTDNESLEVFIASMTNFQFLYFSANYNSNTYFSGRDIDVDQYNIVPQITYMDSRGFYASLSGIYYSEFEPNWDVTTATAGYGNSLGKKKLWPYFASYSYYYYSNDIDNLYHSTLNGGIGINNKTRSLGAQVSGAYYFGDEVTYQIVLRSYANLKLLKTKKQSLRLRPQFSIVTGTQLVDLTSGSIQKTLLLKEPDPADSLYPQENVFGLINTQINVPLQYTLGYFDFELGFNYNIPSELGNESDLKNTHFFNFGLAYLLDL